MVLLLALYVGTAPTVKPGDVDVVKLFSLPEAVGDDDGTEETSTRTWWQWMVKGRALKLRNGQHVRNRIVQALLNLVQTSPLVYVEEDREKKGKLRAMEILITERDGVKKRVQETLIMKSGV